MIIKKYIQYHNHALRTFEIKQFDYSSYKLYFGERMRDEFYAFAEVGDTIRKRANSLTYMVIKPDGDTASFFLDFYCGDTLNLPK